MDYVSKYISKSHVVYDTICDLYFTIFHCVSGSEDHVTKNLKSNILLITF